MVRRSFRPALLTALLLPAAAFAQSGTFDLQTGGRSIGQNTFKLDKAKGGYKLQSKVTYHLNGTEGNLTDNFKLDDNYVFVDGDASNIASQMHTSYQPNKARTEMVLGTIQAGIQDSKHLPVKPNLVLMPNYDAGAAQAVLLEAITHPTPDNLYNVVVPAGGGSGAPSSAASGSANLPPTPMGNFAYDALFSKGPDTSGTLDGKPVNLHTYTLTSGKNTWTFYADETNNLMQLNNSMLRANYVRQKFALVTP